MVSVRKITPEEVGAVVGRIAQRMLEDAGRCSYVNSEIAPDELARALHDATSSTWVAREHGKIVGHLYGALLESESYARGVWVGPDGVSFDSSDVLAELYAVAGQEWIDADALEHYVWVLDDAGSTDPWYELGFSRMHLRGVLELDAPRTRALPDGYRMRRGTLDDLDHAVTLTIEIDRAQAAGPSFAIYEENSSQRDELYETLSDPEVTYYVVEHGDVPVAQCIIFPLPARRGSFEATWHLSAVAVREQHQHRGIASAMIDYALGDARDQGCEFVETTWRVTNRQAARYWKAYGFHPTFVRLHRTIGAG